MKKILWIGLVFFSVHAFSQKTVKKDQIRFTLTEVTIRTDTLIFEMTVVNHSVLSYKVRYVKFFIRDRHLPTRTAVQEVELSPLISNIAGTIISKDCVQLFLAFPQFTIPKKKELVIALKEKSGTRDLALHIRGNKLLRMIRRKD